MIKGFFKFVYPLGLLIILQNSNFNLYIPNFDFYSWNFMYYWIIYIIPILYYLYFIYSHYKEIVFEFKDKVYNKFKEEWNFSEFPVLIKILLFLLILPTMLIFIPVFVLNGIKQKNIFSYFIIISYITFFISIFLFYFRFRFKGSSLFQIELLSGDVFFLIIPFILSSVVVFNQEFKKLDE
jgi:hypothetical protein